MNRHARGSAGGFTVLELATVLLMISILAVVAAPTFSGHIKRARLAEALGQIHTIASLERGYALLHGEFLACSPSPAAVPAGRLARFEVDPTWQSLGFRPVEAVRYQYEVKASAGRFEVIARGDLDGDGEQSEIRLASDAVDLVFTRELE
jgi:Tfp pilus assembly protein PilE